MPLGSLKKKVKSKKSFSFQFKEKKRGRDMQWLGPKASNGCCGTSFASAGVPFSGQMPLGNPKKRVKSKNAFHFGSKKRSADVTCNGSALGMFTRCHLGECVTNKSYVLKKGYD
jgi:hypothetical protein